MEHGRGLDLQMLLDLAEAAILARGDEQSSSAAVRVFERLTQKVGAEVAAEPRRLPVCRFLDAAYAGMAAGASPLPELASAFSALDPRLCWERRATANPADTVFFDGHANAVLIGPRGLEQREDVWVGVSLMAPGVLYPDHSHPPEEVYFAFTAGQWWNTRMGWAEPGPGGLVYNEPGIMHAMRSGSAPLLALWLLPID